MSRTADRQPAPERVSVRADVRLLKGVVPADGGRVPFLLRLQGVLPERADARTPIDLALVLDHSGSMGGAPLEAAKQAAHDAVDLLEDGDRVAIVIYDGQVEVLVPTTPVDDRASLHRAIGRIRVGGSTALHAGWLEGAQQLVDLLDPARTARVVLLTDGHANVGVVDPAEIAADVAKMAAHGVATSTIGLGRGFNEDLLAHVADAGGGRFGHAETPAELEGVMAAELIGIDATAARRVRARFDADGVAAEVVDVLNDFPSSKGELALPDLVAEMPLDVVGVLHVRPAKPHLERALGSVELSWSDLEGRPCTASIPVSAPVVPAAEYRSAADDPDVAVAVAVLTAARHREAAMRAIDRGDDEAVEHELAEARRLLDRAPGTDRVRREREALERVREALRMRDHVMARKRAAAQRFTSRTAFYEDTMMHSVRYSEKQGRLAQRRAEREATRDDDPARPHRAGVAGGSLFADPSERGDAAAGGPDVLEVARPGGGVGVLRLRVGDITDWTGDAIVNPTNPHLHGTGASVDGAVHRRGGMDLTRECRAIGHVEIGQAVVTKGWDLPADYVLHTAVPMFDGSDEAYEALAACYRSSLRLARQLRLARLAFPAIGTGTNGFPTGRAAEVALNQIVEGLRHPDGPERVDVVLYDRRAHATFQRALARVTRQGARPPGSSRRPASTR